MGSYEDIRRSIPDAESVKLWAGHSRGGAIATLAALDYGGECWTYGSPRVLNYAGARRFTWRVKASRRYVFVLDPVAMVPTAGYFHVYGRRVLWQRGLRHSMERYAEAVI
jgi:hypothetical protein